MPSIVSEVDAAIESSRACQGSGKHLLLSLVGILYTEHNVCSRCLGLVQLFDGIGKNHSPEGTWALNHLRWPGEVGGTQIWAGGVVCSLEPEPAHHLYSVNQFKILRQEGGSSRQAWEGCELLNRKRRSYLGFSQGAALSSKKSKLMMALSLGVAI